MARRWVRQIKTLWLSHPWLCRWVFTESHLVKSLQKQQCPHHTSLFFLEALDLHKICPDILRTDCGTENGIMASMQALIPNDIKAHRYGTSQSNIRIENLWSHFKRTYTTWIINYFKDMVSNDELRLGNHFQMECAWFVYSGLLQSELDKMVEEWNTHTIRKSRHTEVWGVPDELFDITEMRGFQKCGRLVEKDLTDWLDVQGNVRNEADAVLNSSDLDLAEYFKYVVNERGISMPPRDWDEAKKIYMDINMYAFE